MWMAGRDWQLSHTHSSQKHLQEYRSQTAIPASRYAVAIQQKAHLGSHRETGTDRINARELDGSFGSECFNLSKIGQLKWFLISIIFIWRYLDFLHVQYLQVVLQFSFPKVEIVAFLYWYDLLMNFWLVIIIFVYLIF